MQYTIEAIENGVATVTFADGSWANVRLESTMTAEEVDAAVFEFAPKNGSKPSFLNVGESRTAAEIAEDAVDGEQEIETPAWMNARRAAYGDIYAQVEYITENGLEAWQTHVAEIKAANPKT